jgi:S1-C subfamily serine protease
VIQGVAPGGSASDSLAPGDVIVEVNRVPVPSSRDAARLIQATPKGESVLFKVRSHEEGKTRFVAIERR